jgi:hypothetical protein
MSGIGRPLKSCVHAEAEAEDLEEAFATCPASSVHHVRKAGQPWKSPGTGRVKNRASAEGRSRPISTPPRKPEKLLAEKGFHPGASRPGPAQAEGVDENVRDILITLLNDLAAFENPKCQKKPKS